MKNVITNIWQFLMGAFQKDQPSSQNFSKKSPKFSKIGKYIVTLEGIHGILHNIVSVPSSGNAVPHVSSSPQIIITYIGGLSACLEFDNLEDSQKGFDKLADLLSAI